MFQSKNHSWILPNPLMFSYLWFSSKWIILRAAGIGSLHGCGILSLGKSFIISNITVTILLLLLFLLLLLLPIIMIIIFIFAVFIIVVVFFSWLWFNTTVFFKVVQLGIETLAYQHLLSLEPKCVVRWGHYSQPEKCVHAKLWGSEWTESSLLKTSFH